MMPLISAIFLASLLGSLHCTGMCGAFLALAVDDRGDWRRHAILQTAYHGGRLLCYVALGAAAGAAGQILNLGGALAGVRSAAAVLAGVTILLFAAVTLLRILGVRAPGIAGPSWLGRLGRAAYVRAMKRPPIPRALLIGLCTTLLPCGWLYAFVATAAGTASPLAAAGVMGVFWLGTLPAMIALGAGVRTVLGPLNRRMPLVTCVALVAIGLYTVVGRAGVDPRALIGTKSISAGIPVPGSAACCNTNDHARH
jgi:sulfite exporter TauE/SafE